MGKYENNKPFTKESLSISKPILGGISPKMLDGMGKVLAKGAEKYGRANWSKCKPEDIHLYWDALFRHLNAFRMGENCDEESGENHLYHAACNLQFIIELKGVNYEYK